ncbi:TIGR00341 family protein [Thermococcus sp. 21S7]|uniref:TIGR00341 family protein n=1 Tax=Thermococcus sp. 21S7 TaxID=1638221 RepID=UPI00143C4D91|nr:TIGR00341 family protein [Thermococcus sp. 21S7]NJE61751.1 TIGR00341 family protein [Thermococcus sp. 21S7]
MLRLEIYCDEGEGEKVREVLTKWSLQFYAEEVQSNEHRALKFTALVPDFVINDVVDELMKAVDLRKGHSSITWAPVSGKSVKYANSVKSLKKFKRRWTLAAIEGLIENANNQARVDPIQLTLGAVASIIALFGLINDSIVMIISAMLLSPILGPLYGFSLNIVMGRGRDALDAVSSILKLLGVIFLSAFLVSLALRFAGSMPPEPTHEILVRGDSGLVYIFLALILGYAGIVAIVSRIPEILAGVSIAAALVPPTTVIGISLAMGWWGIFRGSLALTVENVLGLLSGSLLGLYVLNVSPRSYYERRAAKLYTKRTMLVLAIMLAALVLVELLG